MSPDQDNDLLTMALESLHLNKLRRWQVVLVGETLHPVGLAAHLRPAGIDVINMDFSELELRVGLGDWGDGDHVPIGFSGITPAMLTARFADLEVAATPIPKNEKHWSHLNKQRKKGRW